LEPADSIDSFDLDQISGALMQLNAENNKNVVLFILIRGGEGRVANISLAVSRESSLKTVLQF